MRTAPACYATSRTARVTLGAAIVAALTATAACSTSAGTEATTSSAGGSETIHVVAAGNFWRSHQHH